MDTTLAILLLLAISAGVLFPGLIWVSRLPPMDREGDDFGVSDDPLLRWPPNSQERAQLQRITGLLVVMAVVLLLLLLALYLAWRAG